MQRFITQPKNIITMLLCVCVLATTISITKTEAAINPEINYQGKLTNASNIAVADDTYNMRFWLLTSPSIATTSAIWTESLTGTNKVQVTNGLFSIMLGSTTPLTGIDFNQTLYLGVEVGGTSTLAWDGEMSPRKILGAVPAAFEAQNAQTLGNIATTSFLRSDQADTASGLLTFTGGFIANSSSTITDLTTLIATTTTLVINGSPFTSLTGTGLTNSGGTLTCATANGSTQGCLTAGDWNTFNQKVSTSSLNAWAGTTNINTLGTITSGTWNGTQIGATYGGTGLTTITQNQLLIGGAGNTWSQISTSSLNIAAANITGLGTLAIKNSINDSDWSGAQLTVGNGGTGQTTLGAGEILVGNGTGAITSTTTANLRTSLGLNIGTNVQAYDADLTTWAGITPGSNVGTFLATPASANLFTAMTDKTGSGGTIVFSASPTFTGTPTFSNLYSSPTGTSTLGYASTTAFTVNGNTYFPGSGIWNSSGNVGIGTSTPSSQLTIQGTAGNTQNLFTVASSTGSASLAVLSTGDVEMPNNVITAGVKWTLRTPAANNDWQSITYGNGLFVAVASNGTNRVMTSPDGINWTSRSAASASTWNFITYSNGLFVAVGNSGAVMTSPDGINWTSRSASEANNWQSVTYGNGLFVAVASNGTNRVMVSPDGINWTARSVPATVGVLMAVTYGNGLFVAVADSGTYQVMTSPDGINWTARSAGGDINYWQSITYGNGLFVAINGDLEASGYWLMTSPDGINWTTRSVTSRKYTGVAYGNGLFVTSCMTDAGYGICDVVMTSPDGINWTARSVATSSAWSAVTYGNGMFVAVADTSGYGGNGYVMTSGKTFTSALAHNNIYHGGMSVLGGAFNIGTTTGSTSPFYSNILNIASTTGLSLFTITNTGNVGIGTTTPNALLNLDKRSLTGSVVGGMKQYLSFTNSTEDAVYYGDESYFVNAPTATSTLVGKMIRVEDTSVLGNVVRGLEVQAHRGTNTAGENTALSGYARTFGVSGVTFANAGEYNLPAGVFAETRGTTQGNALRAYSGTITTENLVSIFHDTSAFTGTGLEMNLGNSGGSFAATSTAKFLDLQVAGTSKFIVAANGSTTIGDGTVSASLLIPYGGICVDSDGTCLGTVNGQIASVSTFAGNSDLAEMYFSNQVLHAGEIVSLSGGLSVNKANASTSKDIIGVVSTKPGLLLGFDDASLIVGETGYPIGLAGRVPIKLSTENGPIKKGDRITISSISGIGMKATESSRIVGIALEDYDGTQAYSEGFLNQFGDDLIKEKIATQKEIADLRTQDGCYYGGGNPLGEEECAPRPVSVTPTEEIIDTTYEDTLAILRNERPREMQTKSGEVTYIGQSLMFIELSQYQLDTESTILAELASTTLLTNGTNNETLWSRLKTLAMNFVDGVLTVVEVVADTFTAQKVDTNVLCVGDTCVDEATLKALLQGSSQTPVQNTQRSGGSVDTTVPDTTSTPTTTPQTSSSTPLDLTNPPDPTSDGASTTPAISEVLPEPPVEETTSPPIEQTEPTDPTPSKDTNPPDTAPDVAILPATPEPTNEPITP